MRRKNCCPPQADDIPAWFMTYSDVITLLMTFFILLLTFASTEPEHFQRLQSVMFGGGSVAGIAGAKLEELDKDAIVLRQRPPASRIVLHGSEMPPMYSDASLNSLTGGLEALDERDQEDERAKYEILASLPLLVDDEGRLSAVGENHLGRLAQQLRQLGLEVTLEFGGAAWQSRALALSRYLITDGRVPMWQVHVSRGSTTLPAPHLVRITIERPSAE